MSIQTTAVTTTASAIYTSSGDTAVTYCQLTNYSGSSIQANLFVVPNGSSASDNTIAIANLTIASKNSYQIYSGNEKIILANGDALIANVSANTAVTSIVSYTSV